MKTTMTVRTRFAPAPTGMMHLGNIRAALINFLFAKHANGSYILRIEDTDMNRMFDVAGKQICYDLAWLGITHDEGPNIGGPYAPYIQSQRTKIYQKYLEQLIAQGAVYRCFCTPEELERKRKRQQELKKAPRYDRTCLNRDHALTTQLVERNTPCIWRFALPTNTVTIHDLVRGPITFDLSNFSDFPLTRQDESFTFLFANAVDDIDMCITHVFRGEDHLSNSACQAALYHFFQAPLPIFWHMPIICNIEGKKLSKRDFGFSLDDLRNTGFVPEAITNYLGIIGGKALQQEILSLTELAQAIDFSTYHSSGTIKYDSDKLRWMNHAWIQRLTLDTIVARCRPFLERVYPAVVELSNQDLARIIRPIQQELRTLQDVVPLLHGYFHVPEGDDTRALASLHLSAYTQVLRDITSKLSPLLTPLDIIELCKSSCKRHNVPVKELYGIIRIALTGSKEGTSIANLLEIIPYTEVVARLEKLL